MDDTAIPHKRGQRAENIALDFLKEKGLKPLERNFRGAGGEIDLIMLDNRVIVFIEVRYRANNHFLDALESIDSKKCRRIIKASQCYLQSNYKAAQKACRFDIVLISGQGDESCIRWIKNAFQA